MNFYYIKRSKREHYENSQMEMFFYFFQGKQKHVWIFKKHKRKSKLRKNIIKNRLINFSLSFFYFPGIFIFLCLFYAIFIIIQMSNHLKTNGFFPFILSFHVGKKITVNYIIEIIYQPTKRKIQKKARKHVQENCLIFLHKKRREEFLMFF